MVGILLLLSCQIVRLQAAGKEPTTSAALFTCKGWIHSELQEAENCQRTALYVSKRLSILQIWPQSVMPVWLHGLGRGQEVQQLFSVRAALKGQFDILGKYT